MRKYKLIVVFENNDRSVFVAVARHAGKILIGFRHGNNGVGINLHNITLLSLLYTNIARNQPIF